MTDNQKGRLNEMAAYARKIRSETEDLKLKEVCTNVLAWILLIEGDE